MIKFTILGNPIPKQGDRSFINWKAFNKKTMKRGIVCHYQPKVITDRKKEIMAETKKYAPPVLLDDALAVQIIFYLEKPKSKSKKEIWAKWKPDADNLEKFLSDCLKDVIYTEDSRICEFHIIKQYGNPSRTEVTIEILGDSPIYSRVDIGRSDG